AYEYPREKKPSSASTRMTIRMIQRMPTFASVSFAPAETKVSAWRERQTGGSRLRSQVSQTDTSQGQSLGRDSPVGGQSPGHGPKRHPGSASRTPLQRRRPPGA